MLKDNFRLCNGIHHGRVAAPIILRDIQKACHLGIENCGMMNWRGAAAHVMTVWHNEGVKELTLHLFFMIVMEHQSQSLADIITRHKAGKSAWRELVCWIPTYLRLTGTNYDPDVTNHIFVCQLYNIAFQCPKTVPTIESELVALLDVVPPRSKLPANTLGNLMPSYEDVCYL